MAAGLTGGCACGAVRYELASEPMWVQCCHCRDCQRQTGSAFAVNGLIETDRIAVTGLTPVAIGVPTDSGRIHDIYRCPQCQTALWSDYGGKAYLRYVRAGTLDEPGRLRPDVHVHVRSRLDWVRIPDDVPAFDAFYDMKSVWSEQAQSRRAEASARYRT
ncbi:MAG TPA: GFA family protein [Devosiaceae bacterium]